VQYDRESLGNSQVFMVSPSDLPTRANSQVQMSRPMMIPQLQLHPKWTLIPDDIRPLRAHPVLLPRKKLEIKIPQHLADDQPHLRIGEVLTNAISRPDAERAVHVSVIII
jgi:hypothetical protein